MMHFRAVPRRINPRYPNGWSMTKSASELLDALTNGDRSREPQLIELVYKDLRKLAQHYMQQETVGHTMQPTALVHEAFLKLINQPRIDEQSRSHFFAIGAQAMRRVLVSHARRKSRLKRGGDRLKLSLDEALTVSNSRDEDVLALDEALEKLGQIDPRQAQIVELRFFGGMSVEETAAAMGMSKRAVEREWTACRAWLRRELAEQDGT
jgi:RNA polymerase sigma-70 factor (ECF subfamily)